MNTTFLSLLAIGLVGINIILILSALLSVKFEVDIKKLALLALLFYLSLGFFGVLLVQQSAGPTLTGLVGLYEAVFGIRIMKRFGAKMDIMLDDMQEVMDEQDRPHPLFVVSMVVIYMFIGWLGGLMV